MVDGCCLMMMMVGDDDGTTFSKYTWCWKGFCLLSSALVVFHKHDNGPGQEMTFLMEYWFCFCC